MNLNDLCQGGDTAVVVRLKETLYGGSIGMATWLKPDYYEHGLHPIRMKCPKCGRKVMSCIKVNQDGDVAVHTVPAHKPKGWWKKRGR